MTDRRPSQIDKFSQEFGQMQNKLDQILHNQAHMMGRHDKLDERVTEHHGKLETRVSNVEAKLNWYAGGLAAIAAFITLAGDKIRSTFFGAS